MPQRRMCNVGLSSVTEPCRMRCDRLRPVLEPSSSYVLVAAATRKWSCQSSHGLARQQCARTVVRY